jgi:hypothetical protein
MTKDPKNYLFPGWLAKRMAKVDMRVQYEASMMSMALIFVGLIASAIYLPFYTSFATWYKVFLIINLLAGMGFMGSYLVTTYQQYRTYLETLEFQQNMKGGTLEDGKKV